MKKHLLQYRSKLRAAIAGGAITAFAAGNAYAGDLSAGFMGGLDMTELTLIGVGVLTAVGVIFLISSARRAGR